MADNSRTRAPMTRDRSGIRERLGLRPVINVAGTMTSLGASIAVPEAIGAAAGILPEFVEIDDLQRLASGVIGRVTGAEAGCVTASASAGVTISIAAAMTGADLARIERLPDTRGMKDEVAVQSGHLCHYGAPVEQAVRLAGASVAPVGAVNAARPDQLEARITERTAAVLIVVSHHTVQQGQIALEDVVAVCRRHGVPVIADLAAEYDLTGYLARGVDLAVYSAHKFLGGLTAGIVAGAKPLVRAAYLQNLGIGRGMKVGKEGIVGAVAALEAWEARDHEAARRRQQEHLALWRGRLANLPGVRLAASADPTGNPVERLRVHLDPKEARVTAWELEAALAVGAPPVVVGDEFLEQGCFELDPCNLHPGEAELVAGRIEDELQKAKAAGRTAHGSFAEYRREAQDRLLAWPD